MENQDKLRQSRLLSTFEEGDVIYTGIYAYKGFYLLKKREEKGFNVQELKIFPMSEGRDRKVDFLYTHGLHYVWDAQEWLDNEVERLEKERIERLLWSDKLYQEVNEYKEKQKKDKS
jgi:hypothetical protein